MSKPYQSSGWMKNSSYYIALVGVRTHDLPHTVASNMVKVSHASNHSATAAVIETSSVIHLSVQYRMAKGLSHTPPLLLGTLFLNRSAFLIMSLLSDPELQLAISVLPINSLNISVVICVSQSFMRCVVG